MSTKWISLCDICGREEEAGDDEARAIFGLPEQPDNAYFRYSAGRGDARSVELKLDLCGPCGTAFQRRLREIVPDAKYWTESEGET
jgi:hypothetical protein